MVPGPTPYQLAPGLTDLQQGRCFYCRGPLRAGQVDVDHFVPWSRMANDGLANLVLADRLCNNAKSDFLASLEHLERWATRSPETIRQLGDEAGWPIRAEESRRLAAGIYSRLPAGTPLWGGRGHFELATDLSRGAALKHLVRPCPS